jgi:hypothetical protein
MDQQAQAMVATVVALAQIQEAEEEDAILDHLDQVVVESL